MEMQSKSFRGVEIKSADKGEVSAVIATLNVVDKDGDVATRDTFEDGAELLISAYQHKSWEGALPIGEGRLRVTNSEAIMDGRLFLDTDEGRNTFAVLKQLGTRQEWSYGYDVLQAAPGTFDGQDVQFLQSVKVHEASPVLRGAGENTRTLSVKGRKDPEKIIEEGRKVSDYRAAVRPHETAVSLKSWSAKAAEDQLEALPTIVELRSLYAWCDPDGDPELKTSYRFAHHDAPGGPANIRACMAGMAKLNGAAGGAGIPDADRRGVYNHLAAHMIDADFEPAELRTGSGGELKFHEEAAAALAGLDSLLERASEVVALRRSKGKALAATSVLQLEWLHDGLKQLRSLLDTPQEDAAREYARFVQYQLQHSTTPEGV